MDPTTDAAPAPDTPAATPRLYDTHCHLNHLDLVGTKDGSDTPGWEEVWARAEAVGVQRAMVVGTDSASSRRAAEIATARPEALRWAPGLHPTEAGRFDEEWPQVEAMARAGGDQAPPPAALGETGYDFYWDKSTPREQERSFVRHLELALELRLPVVIHCRDAFETTFATLRAFGDPLPAGIMHCFSGGPDEAREALDLGLMLSFAGPVTYPRSDALREAAAFAPEDRILIETDTPFLPPQGRRGQRNEPAWIAAVAERLAEVRGTSPGELARRTDANARALLG